MFHRLGGLFRICRQRAGEPRLLRIALYVAPTKLVSMARPAAPEAPIWVLAFNKGSPSGFALSRHATKSSTAHGKFPGAAGEFDAVQGNIRAYAKPCCAACGAATLFKSEDMLWQNPKDVILFHCPI